MALCFALGSLCFLSARSPATSSSSAPARTRSRSSPAPSSSPRAARCRRRSPPGRARPAPRGRRGGRRSSSPPARCSSTSRPTGPCTPPVDPRVRPARLAPGRVRLDLLPRLGRDRLPRVAAPRVAARSRRPGWWEPRGQPARVSLLRHRGGRRLRRPLERLDARPGRRELEHGARRGLLPGLRAGDPAHRTHDEVAALRRLRRLESVERDVERVV